MSDKEEGELLSEDDTEAIEKTLSASTIQADEDVIDKMLEATYGKEVSDEEALRLAVLSSMKRKDVTEEGELPEEPDKNKEKPVEVTREKVVEERRERPADRKASPVKRTSDDRSTSRRRLERVDRSRRSTRRGHSHPRREKDVARKLPPPLPPPPPEERPVIDSRDNYDEERMDIESDQDSAMVEVVHDENILREMLLAQIQKPRSSSHSPQPTNDQVPDLRKEVEKHERELKKIDRMSRQKKESIREMVRRRDELMNDLRRLHGEIDLAIESEREIDRSRSSVLERITDLHMQIHKEENAFAIAEIEEDTRARPYTAYQGEEQALREKLLIKLTRKDEADGDGLQPTTRELCPWELNGKCKDFECEYIHPSRMSNGVVLI